MAEDSDSAGTAEPPLPFPNGLIEWEKIHRLPPGSPPRSPWSMVAIRTDGGKNPPIVFPPINHENLLVSTDPSPNPDHIPHIHTDNLRIPFTDDSDSETNSSSTFSPSDSSPVPRSPLFPAPSAAPARQISEILHSKLSVLARFLYSGLTSSRGVLVTFRSAAFPAVLVAFLYFRRRRRLRAAEESRSRLIGIIHERDERINQLLEQISQMNQMLLKLHRSPN